MADPLSIAASLLAVTTAALQSTRSLYDTVKRFQGRDKTLRRLRDELEHLTTILASLTEVTTAEQSMITLLQGPVERCAQICRDFKDTMESFGGQTKPGFRDWAKLEFMKGDINEFIDSIAGYKATISVGVGTITLSHTSKISQHVLHEYNEMVQDTAYGLELHLRRIDEKMTGISAQQTPTSNVTVDLEDEKGVTQQCLRVCEDAFSYIQSVAEREATLLDTFPNRDDDDTFEAQQRTRDALKENRDKFSETIDHLRARLGVLLQRSGPESEAERSRLQADIDISKQCLNVCKVASEVSRQTIYRIGEVVAEGDSDQVVVTTLADLFDIKKAYAKDNAAQLVGSMTSDDLRHIAEKRYTSRSEILAIHPDRAHHSSASLQASPGEQASTHSAATRYNSVTRPAAQRSEQRKPMANENKKRYTDEAAEQD